MKNLSSNKRKNIIFIFIFTVLYYIIWYSLLMPIVRCIVSSDEFLSIAIGVTSFSNLDWSALIDKVNRYYGNGYTILFTPIMFLIKSAYVRYFIMHIANALIHGMIAILCYSMYTTYLSRPHNLEAVLISLNVSLFYFEGLEGTNVYNELPLYFCVWLALYEIMWLFNVCEDKKKKIGGTIVLGITLLYSLSLHTRAIFTIGAVVVTIVLVRIIWKKYIVNIPLFIALISIGALLVEIIGAYIRSLLWSNEVVQNTVAGAFGRNGVFSKLGIIFTIDGMRGFVTTIIGRLFGMICTSGGILCFSIAVLFIVVWEIRDRRLLEHNSEKTYFSIAMIFLGTVIVASFLLFGLNATNSVSEAIKEQKMTYWAFYLRYHFLYFIPLIPFIYGSMQIYVNERKRILKITIYCFISLMISSIILLSPLFVNESARYRMKIVYYAFLPFTAKAPLEIIDDRFLFSNLVVGGSLFIIHFILLYKQKVKWSNIVSIFTSVYIFSYVMVNLFIPESKEIYGATDMIYDYVNDFSVEELGQDTIYYVGFTHLEVEVLQFELCDWKITDDLTDIDLSNGIIISNHVLTEQELLCYENENIIFQKLEDKEYIYFIGDKIIERISQLEDIYTSCESIR